MPASLDNLASQLRAAVLAGSHVEAERLAVSYVQALQQTWESLSEGERGASTVPRQACELMAWMRDVTLMQRALTSEQLAALEKTWQYQPAGRLEPRSRAIEVKV